MSAALGRPFGEGARPEGTLGRAKEPGAQGGNPDTPGDGEEVGDYCDRESNDITATTAGAWTRNGEAGVRAQVGGYVGPRFTGEP